MAESKKRNNKIMRMAAGGALAIGLIAPLAACSSDAGSSDAEIASRNLSTAAEYFEVDRRIVFFNGITDAYLLTIEGRCSVESADSALGGSLEVTCKIGPDEFKKHFLGLSDNVSYLVEQLEPIDVSTYHYRVVFKPQSIVPEIEMKVGE